MQVHLFLDTTFPAFKREKKKIQNATLVRRCSLMCPVDNTITHNLGFKSHLKIILELQWASRGNLTYILKYPESFDYT